MSKQKTEANKDTKYTLRDDIISPKIVDRKTF
jgi:hypothetical protein